jgi:N-acetylglucosaminyldiphosphoundecaprenol N-acetyl-beta-D-mannosaminyltransferase
MNGKSFAVRISSRNRLQIFNGNPSELIAELGKIIENWDYEKSKCNVVTAVHIGGLNELTERYLNALNDARIVYADGISVEILARISGASSTRRAPTTDIGFQVLRIFREITGSKAKVALIGGPVGLASRAGAVLESSELADVVSSHSGFQSTEEWIAIWKQLERDKPDFVFVGLGSPKEALVLHEFKKLLPGALYLTCGGWFGFITGEEKRAPLLLRRLGLEWIYRLSQSPKRLAARYFRGSLNLSYLVSLTTWHRFFGRSK